MVQHADLRAMETFCLYDLDALYVDMNFTILLLPLNKNNVPRRL